jgi:hypothetical protein
MINEIKDSVKKYEAPQMQIVENVGPNVLLEPSGPVVIEGESTSEN